MRHAESFSKLCPLCDEGFHKNRDRNNHMRLKHPNSFKCVTCLCQFSSSPEYAEHMKKLHNESVDRIEHKQTDISALKFKATRLENRPKDKHKILSVAEDKSEKAINAISDDIDDEFIEQKPIRRLDCPERSMENKISVKEESNQDDDDDDDEEVKKKIVTNVKKPSKPRKP